MACGVSHQHHCLHLFSVHASYCFGSYNCSSNSSVSPLKCSTKCGNGYHSARFRTIPKASANKNPSSIPQQPKPRVADDRVNARDPDTDPNPNSLSVLHRLREQFKLDGLGVEILSIALPAALALDADPITSLVDTGFVGHLGSAELAAVGVSGAVFNLVSKLFDVPLLNITTSYVAEEQASVIKAADGYSQSARGQRCKMFLPSVSNAIVLAAALGIIEAVALSTGSSFLMDTMGISDSPMRVPAEQFLTLRTFGAPPIVVIALAAQCSRNFSWIQGYKDTFICCWQIRKIMAHSCLKRFDLVPRG
ncbi:hypothetical protein DH2020_001654 [Rehmannia glutinosa]|uniref:Uncharacterized protein n=1 Tax=Rehmannia glutinosa TaxID=99300 RepID=A0ABR0Y0I9_REHGL